MRKPLISLFSFTPHPIILPVGQMCSWKGSSSDKVAEETYTTYDHLPKYGSFANVRLNMKFSLDVGLSKLPQLGKLSGNPVGQILHE